MSHIISGFDLGDPDITALCQRDPSSSCTPRDNASFSHQDLSTHLCVYVLLESCCQPWPLVLLQSNMHEISLDISCNPVQMCQISMMSYNNCGPTDHSVPHQMLLVSRPEEVPPILMTCQHVSFIIHLIWWRIITVHHNIFFFASHLWNLLFCECCFQV